MVGPGGVGKTRLALTVASGATRFGRTRWVDLSPLSHDSRVEGEIAAAVDAAGGDQAAVMTAISSRSTLLVIDNCEHLVSAAATNIDRLLRGSSASVLATSREPLRVEGEAVYMLPALAQADAVALFRDRAIGIRASDGELTKLCDRLERLPLALELAAARTQSMSVASLIRSLDRPLEVLVGGARSSPERLQRLERSISWSYDLLTNQEQTAFRALGVFDGGFGLEAAVAVAKAEINVILQLVECSLVAQDPSDRYRLLYPVREFARRRLKEADEERMAEDRHDGWVVELMARLREDFRSNNRDAYRVLWGEREMIWPALERLGIRDSDVFVTLAASFAASGFNHLLAREADALAERAVAKARPDHPDLWFAHYVAATAAEEMGDLQRATVHAEAALQIADQTGDPLAIAGALVALAIPRSIEAQASQLPEIDKLLLRGLQVLGSRAPALRAFLLNSLGMAHWEIADYEIGEDYARQATQLASESAYLDTLALNLIGQGRLEDATAAARGAARHALQRGETFDYLLRRFAELAMRKGEEERCAIVVSAARRSWEEVGRPALDGPALWDEAEYVDLSRHHPRAAERGYAMVPRDALEYAAELVDEN